MTFVKYHTINFPETRGCANAASPIRRHWPLPSEGKPLPNGAYLLAEVYSAKLDADKKPVMRRGRTFVADQRFLHGDGARGRLGQERPDDAA